MPANVTDGKSETQPMSRLRGRPIAGRATGDHREKPWTVVSLPPFPAVAMRVLALLAKEELGLRELTLQLQSDPVLASEILTLANSPLFAFRTEVRTVLQATTLLGAQRVKGIALTIAMKTYLTESFQIPALLASWRHNLACALVAEEIARVSLIEKDFAYLAGLLHDVGRLALGMMKPLEYADLLSSAEINDSSILEEEREMFGVDHCQAGKRLMQSWKLPKTFLEVAEHHHAPSGSQFDIVALVNRSCMIADAIGFSAFNSATPRRFENVLMTLPERERRLFNPDPEQFAMNVAIKIHSLE
ncbi:MAG: HDOD domain-containing protein [Terriglobia bacterium]